jgi:hypothetical protein
MVLIIKSMRILFNYTKVWHAQFIAASERGHEMSALNFVFDSAIFD